MTPAMPLGIFAIVFLFLAVGKTMRYFKGGDMSSDIFSKLFVQTPASIANKADVDYTLPCYSDSL
jgi:hypothetical protein